VRRLLVLVASIVLVDTMLFAALTPLLPGYVEEYGLSKIGAGLLVGSYAAGVLVAGIPSGFAAARFGPRPAAVSGLLLIAAASVGFAFAGDVWTLGAFRLVQGLGSALSWSGGLAWLVASSPRERRAELLGTALAAAVVGALLGPVLGGAAALVGARPAFAAVGAAAALLAAIAARTPEVPAEPAPAQAVRRALGEPRVLGGLWLMLLPALLFGVLAVLVPLELDDAGWAAAAIGAVFLVAAALEAGLAPVVGRIADRRGRIAPIRVALVASVVFSLALAWAGGPALVTGLVLLASLSYGALFTPGMALLSDGADAVAVPQALVFGLMNAAWATGNAAGPVVAGALADAAGDVAAYGVSAAVSAATLIVVAPRARPGTLLVRVPGRP
jgi:MFS family permease